MGGGDRKTKSISPPGAPSGTLPMGFRKTVWAAGPACVRGAGTAIQIKGRTGSKDRKLIHPRDEEDARFKRRRNTNRHYDSGNRSKKPEKAMHSD